MLYSRHSADTNDPPASETMYQRCMTSHWLSVCRGSQTYIYIYIYIYILSFYSGNDQ